jgi:pimeloyl-ACP methyl ester carboxylesterase
VPEPLVKTEGVFFFTVDDEKIAGTLYGEGGDFAVILGHMGEEGSNNRASWASFGKVLADRGIPALAIDFRGYGGSAAAEPSYTRQAWDVLGAKEFLQGLGYERVVCMGASMGGSACFEAALQDPSFVGLAIIASPVRATEEEVAVLTMPKLFVCEKGDPYNLLPDMTETYRMVPGPKSLKTFAGTAHGTRMFGSPVGEEFSQALLDFLEQLRDSAGDTE